MIKKDLMNKGKFFEEIAINYLKNKGYKIIETNFHSRWGEIDIIGLKDNCLVAFEVKGGIVPFEKINQSKIQKIIKTLEIFSQQNKIKYKYLRIDAIFISFDKENHSKFTIEHIENITM